MIRNEAEYQIASARLIEERNRLADHRARLKTTNMSDEEIKRVIDPIESFHLQLKEEVESYEQLKRGEFCQSQSALRREFPNANWLDDLTYTNPRSHVTNETNTSESLSKSDQNSRRAQCAPSHQGRNGAGAIDGDGLTCLPDPMSEATSTGQPTSAPDPIVADLE